MHIDLRVTVSVTRRQPTSRLPSSMVQFFKFHSCSLYFYVAYTIPVCIHT